MGSSHAFGDDQCAIPAGAYDPTPEQARTAALAVCARLTPGEASVVLQMLGLIPERDGDRDE